VKVSSHSKAAIGTRLAGVTHQLQGFHEEYQDIPRKPQQRLSPMLPISSKVINPSMNDLREKPIIYDLKRAQGKKLRSQWSKQSNKRVTSRIELRAKKELNVHAS
jgi:hypothetical protein